MPLTGKDGNGTLVQIAATGNGTSTPFVVEHTDPAIATLFGGAALVNAGRVKAESTVTRSPLSDYNSVGVAASGVIKNTAGNLNLIACTNFASAKRYLQLFDRAAAPSAGLSALKSYPLIASNSSGDGFLVLDLDFFGATLAAQGLYFATGIAWGYSTTPLIFTAGTAGDCILEARFL